MAIWRSGARIASRHTGREYDRGFQFRYPKRVDLTFGPWASVSPFGDRDIPPDNLKSLQNGQIVSGSILPLWYRGATVTTATRIARAAKMIAISAANNAQCGVILYTDVATGNGTLTVESCFDVSRFDSFGTPMPTGNWDFTAWGNYIYIVNDQYTSVLRFDLITRTFSVITSMTGNGKKIFVLDNNVVIVKHVAGSTCVASWSVDGLPEDFSSVGSGSATLLNIGTLRGVAVLSDRAFIVGSNGCVTMIPTGGLPAFAFRDLGDIIGTPFDNTIEAAGNAVVYFGHDRRIYRVTGTSIDLLNHGLGDLVYGNICTCYLRNLNVLAIGIPAEARFLLLDVATGRWIGEILMYLDNVYSTVPLLTDWVGPNVQDLRSSSPAVYHRPSIVRMLENRLDTVDHFNTPFTIRPIPPPAGSTYPTAPILVLPTMDFGEEFTVEYVDIHRIDAVQPFKPAITAILTTKEDLDQTVSYDVAQAASIQERGRWCRYPIMRTAMGMKLTVTAQNASGSWVMDQGIDKIVVRLRKQRLEE
jgi:hypothetical protein